MKYAGCLLRRNRMWRIAALILITSHAFGQSRFHIDNPVLPGVADAGVIKYNGEYYIGGVFTNGGYYISHDLVHWQGPVHVFSMDNDWTDGASAGDNMIHADDIDYINGLFHQYWSVNYWGRDKNVIHIGHAVSPEILGPFKEPVKDTWLESRLDPKLFRDDDGKLYLYMVKFTDGNTIWARPMKDPSHFSGEPVSLFSSLPHTWETLDNRVAEGPWVFKYRGKYYMLYNANHTSTRWGNYAIGVATADTPLGFNQGGKYPYPVVKSNQPGLEDRHADLLKYGGTKPGVFEYTFNKPADGDWNKPGYEASGWQKGKAGFGSALTEGSTVRKVLTTWKTPAIWLRRSFTLQKKDDDHFMLRVHHDGDTKVFLNGSLIYQASGRGYTAWNFDRAAAELLKDGENLLAVQSAAGKYSAFLDVSLFDLGEETGDDILYSPGQPNMLRGPNGFEWWLIYMANKNSEPRGQFINRVLFFDKTLYVDGITGINTPGYHPPPAKPAFEDRFDEAVNEWKSKWNIKTGRWNLENKEAVQQSAMLSAVIASRPAAHYLFEANMKMGNAGMGNAGIYAWWKDDQNWLKILLDRRHKRWSYVVKEAGTQKAFSFPLPVDFNFDAYHALTVYKNAGDFTVNIDALPAPGTALVKTKLYGAGIPGIYSEAEHAAFDGILYTIGWDEYDTTVTGWSAAAGDESLAGSWKVSPKGISQVAASGGHAVFKGDMLDAYEYGLQVSVKSNEGSAGMYPVYTDARNYLKAVIDFKNRQFRVSGKRNGSDIKAATVSLERRAAYYTDMKYTDFFEKGYTFDAPAYINAIELSKTPPGRPDTVLENIAEKMDISWLQDGQWHSLDYHTAPSSHPGFAKIVFDPVKMEKLRFINRQGGDTHFYIYKIGVHELEKLSYHLRIVKRKEGIFFFIDGKEVLQMKNDFPASKVGLTTDGTEADFNGITLFHLPE